MKHCFKKFMALLLATLMVMSAFSTIGAVAADTICTHPEEKLTKWQVGGVETVAPTCTTAGYTWYKCECGKVTARDFVPALGHDMAWMAEKVVIDTTTDADKDGKADAVVDYVNGIDCGDTYEIYYGCSRADCDYVEKWTGEGDKDFGPGYKTHNYTSYKISKEPTCLVNGEIELICANHADCPKVKVLVRRLNDNKGEHEFAIGDADKQIILSHKDNNCTEDGYTEYACIYCYIVSGAVEKVVDPKTGHSYDHQYALDAEGVNAGTQFVEEGSCLVKYECTHEGCGATAEQYVHAYGRETYYPNQAGATYESCFWAKKCSRCNDYADVRYEHVIDEDKTEWTVDAENNVCTAHYTCENCGYKWDVRSDDEDEEEAMNAHKSLELLYSIPATCTEYGYNSYICRACGDNLLDPIPPLGHRGTGYDDDADRITVKKATCLAPGGTYIRCDRVINGVKCTEETLVGETEPQLDHKYETVSFTPATCIAVSILVEKCVNGCEDVRTTKGTEVDDDAHAMEDYQVTTFPTCDTDGIAALYCKLCHYEDTAIKYNAESMEHHPNFDFDRIKKFGHVYNPIYHADMDGYKAGLAALPENKDADTKNDITVSTTITAKTVVEIVASCSYEGKTTVTCALCDLNEVITTPKNSENHVNYGTDGTGNLITNGYYEGGYVEGGKTYLRLPNCDSPALLWYYCNSCFQPYSVTDAESNALGHKVDKVTDYDENVDQYTKGTEPTCTEPGVTDKWVIHCKNEFEQLERMKGIKDGDKWYADVNGDGELDADDVELGDAAIGSEYEGFKVVDGYVVKTVTANNITYVYNKYYKVIVKCTHEKTYGGDPLPKRGHDWEVTGDALEAYKNSGNYADAVAPTCESVGYVAKVYCAECKTYKVDENGVTLDGHELPALGHSWMRDGYDAENDPDFVPAKDSTCTETGNIAHYKCSVCKGTDKIEADGTHDNKVGDDVTVAKKPHVKATRDESHYCDNPDHMKAPTCAEVGYGFGDVCANCGTCLGHDVIAKLEHNIIKLTRNTTPSCVDPSFTFEFCTICAHTKACGYKDDSKFIESSTQVPVCAEDHADLVIKNGAIDLGYVSLAIGENTNSFKYAALKFTYSFAADDAVKAAFAAEGANYYVELKTAAGESVAKWTLAYAGGSFELDTTYLAEDLKVTTNLTADMYKKSTFKFDYIPDNVYGLREITDFVYYTGHKYVDAVKPLEGNDYACECVGYIEIKACAICGEELAGSAKPAVEGKGHQIPDHTKETITTKYVPCTAECCSYQNLGDIKGYEYDAATNQLLVDAHENTYVYDPDIVILKSIATSTDRDNRHVVSHFQVYACTKCDFRDIDIAKDVAGQDMVYEEGHNWVEIVDLYVEPTYEKEGSRTYYCADKCGVDNKVVNLGKKSATELTMDVENMLEKEHNMSGIGYTDGSLVALTVKLSSLETLMWGFQFDVVYDQTMVAFEGYEFVTKSFESNQYVIDHLAYTEGVMNPGSNFVRVSASTLTPYDPENPDAVAGATNTSFVGDEDLVVLYFRVNCPTAAEAKFSFKEVKVVNNGNVDVNGDGKIEAAEKNVSADSTDIATVAIRRFMNVCNDEAIDISDALYTWKILSGDFNTTYDVTIDVDKNGVVDITDFQAIYKYVVGDMTYEDVRGKGIPA